MKKLFASFLLTITMIMTPVQKSDAAVGGIVSLFAAAPAVIAIGGVATLVGGVGVFVGDRMRGDAGIITFVGGAILLAAGIVLLDGEQNLEFTEVNSSMEHLNNISSAEMDIYNAELDQLNAINAQITDEAAADKNIDAKARWAEMSDMLSPATLKIAGLNAALLLKSAK